jgi:hypothetical protein
MSDEDAGGVCLGAKRLGIESCSAFSRKFAREPAKFCNLLAPKSPRNLQIRLHALCEEVKVGCRGRCSQIRGEGICMYICMRLSL